MAARPEGEIEEEITGINVTPLVDVMLVLLVIFMVTASLVFTRALPVNLPRAETSDAATRVTWQLAVTRGGRMELNGAPVSRAELAGRMRAEAKINPGLKVDVAADERLSYGEVVAVLDLLKSQGVRHVALAVNPK